MLIVVIPLAKTEIDWSIFQQATFSRLGRSVTRPLDAKNITVRGMAEAIVAYAEFQEEGADYNMILRESGSLLKHFSISFLTRVLDRVAIAEIAFDGDLKILDCEDDPMAFIITASLEAWRTTLINFATTGATKFQRVFAEQILLSFDKMNLGRVFENYSRKSDSSGGIILYEKR